MDVGSFYRSDATALKHIIVWNCLRVCDLNSNHSFWLLTQNSIHGKLPKRNEKSNRVHDRFDFTPGPGVGSVLATNRTGAPAFPSSAVLFIPTFAGCVTTQHLNQKCIQYDVHHASFSKTEALKKSALMNLCSCSCRFLALENRKALCLPNFHYFPVILVITGLLEVASIPGMFGVDDPEKGRVPPWLSWYGQYTQFIPVMKSNNGWLDSGMLVHV